MYTAEYKEAFGLHLLRLAQESGRFEGVCRVGGVGGTGKDGVGLYNHVPLALCVFEEPMLEAAEGELLQALDAWGAAYVNRQAESPTHIKFDTFFQGGLNGTIHLEVTSQIKLKSGNVQILLDKTGRLKGAVQAGSPKGKEPLSPNPEHFDFFFGLRKFEQSWIEDNFISAELRLSDARRWLMILRMQYEGKNVQGAYPYFDGMAQEFRARLMATYPQRLEREIMRDAALNMLSLYEETVQICGRGPIDPKLYYLFYDACMGTPAQGRPQEKEDIHG